MPAPSGRAPLDSEIDGIPLVDHHCHGVVAGELDRGGFEGFINEGFAPARAGTTHFDAPIGLAVRRWCAPRLNLEPLASPEDYMQRRTDLGPEEVNRRLIRDAGLDRLLIDSGFRTGEVLDLTKMAWVADVPTHEIVRIEAVAEDVAAEGPEAASYAEALE